MTHAGRTVLDGPTVLVQPVLRGRSATDNSSNLASVDDKQESWDLLNCLNKFSVARGWLYISHQLHSESSGMHSLRDEDYAILNLVLQTIRPLLSWSNCLMNSMIALKIYLCYFVVILSCVYSKSSYQDTTL